MQSSRHWGGKSNNRELTKVDIKRANKNLEAETFLSICLKASPS